LTIYGTQWLLPFSSHAYGLGSQFVIDPLFTLPLLVGLLGLLVSPRRGPRWNGLGLALCCVYGVWGAGAQQYAYAHIADALTNRGVQFERLVVTAAPLQTLLWRGIAVAEDRWYEVHWSICDDATPPAVATFPRGAQLERELAAHPRVRQLGAFANGMVRYEEDAEGVRVADLRMGQAPYFPFDFLVATRTADGTLQFVEPTRQVAKRVPVGAGLRWLWARMWGDRDAPVK
jgi:inner membrane protein